MGYCSAAERESRCVIRWSVPDSSDTRCDWLLMRHACFSRNAPLATGELVSHSPCCCCCCVVCYVYINKETVLTQELLYVAKISYSEGASDALRRDPSVLVAIILCLRFVGEVRNILSIILYKHAWAEISVFPGAPYTSWEFRCTSRDTRTLYWNIFSMNVEVFSEGVSAGGGGHSTPT